MFGFYHSMKEKNGLQIAWMRVLKWMLIINNPTTFFVVINNKYLCILYLIQYNGTILVKQN